MKKVLILAYTYPPDSRSGTYRILHFANELAKKGNYKPFILTVDEKYYEKGVQLDQQLADQVDENVTVVKTRSFQFRDFILGLKSSDPKKAENISINLEKSQNIPSDKKPMWQHVKDFITEEMCAFPDRQIGWLPFAVYQGVKIIRKENIEIIFATGSPWSSFFSGALIKIFTKCPLIIDYRDPWNDNPFLDKKKSKLFQNGSKYLEKKIFNFADAVITNTDTFNQLLTSKFPLKQSIYTVHNGYSQRDIDMMPIDQSKSKSKNYILTYTGALYGHRSIDGFLIAFKDLIENASFGHLLRLQIIGAENDMAIKCEKILGRDLMATYCYLSGRVPHKECLRLQMKADCLLIFQQGTANQIPRKVFEYLAIRKPILAIVDCEGETSNIINKSRCGVVARDNPESIKSAIEEMYSSHDKRLADIESNDFYKQYEVSQLSNKIENIFKETTESIRRI